MLFFVLVIEVNQNIAMYAIGREQNQDDKIWNQKAKIKSIGMIQATKRGVEEMRLHVVGEAARR
jgi:hypothetical protein